MGIDTGLFDLSKFLPVFLAKNREKLNGIYLSHVDNVLRQNIPILSLKLPDDTSFLIYSE